MVGRTAASKVARLGFICAVVVFRLPSRSIIGSPKDAAAVLANEMLDDDLGFVAVVFGGNPFAAPNEDDWGCSDGAGLGCWDCLDRKLGNLGIENFPDLRVSPFEKKKKVCLLNKRVI